MFQRPTLLSDVQQRFSEREVGLTHPDNPSFIRIKDEGDIELFATDGLGIILHPKNRSISFIADTIKFMTKEDDGLRWNNFSFNPKATTYTEPALVPYEEEDDVTNIYRGLDKYLGD